MSGVFASPVRGISDFPENPGATCPGFSSNTPGVTCPGVSWISPASPVPGFSTPSGRRRGGGVEPVGRVDVRAEKKVVDGRPVLIAEPRLLLPIDQRILVEPLPATAYMRSSHDRSLPIRSALTVLQPDALSA